MTVHELDSNRQLFLDALKPKDKGYILDTWKSKEHRVVWYYTKLYPNLRSTSRQCGESYHPMMGKLTNGRLTIEQSVKHLAKKVLSIRKGTFVNEDMSLRKYPRVTQLRSVTFQRLQGQVSGKVIELLEKEWQKLLRAAVTDDNLGEYRISPLLRFYTANRRLGELSLLSSSLWHCLQTLPYTRLHREPTYSKVLLTPSLVVSRAKSSLHWLAA